MWLTLYNVIRGREVILLNFGVVCGVPDMCPDALSYYPLQRVYFALGSPSASPGLSPAVSSALCFRPVLLLEPLSSALPSALGSSLPPLSPPLSLSAAAQRCGGGDSRPHHASHCLFLSRGSAATSAAVPDPASEKPWLPCPACRLPNGE